jgi:hypothetical protein
MPGRGCRPGCAGTAKSRTLGDPGGADGLQIAQLTRNNDKLQNYALDLAHLHKDLQDWHDVIADPNVILVKDEVVCEASLVKLVSQPESLQSFVAV